MAVFSCLGGICAMAESVVASPMGIVGVVSLQDFLMWERGYGTD